ncbi:MAG: threonine synthase [Syntrophaceae bacterium]|nr:threonine synthase [Syntrophaceae bacterium]
MNRLVCTKCKATYGLNEPVWRCGCGSLLDIEFEPVFDVEAISRRRPTMWRYREAIPVTHDTNIVSFDEGFTPLVEVTFSGKPVLIKQDHLFPTGSYKDRGASVLISKIKELGIQSVVEDSSGNAGCAIAAYCAKAKIACDILVPEHTAEGKLAQINLYGAKLKKIPGTREETAEAALKLSEDAYYASHSWNPFFFQGTKTFAFEVCEQRGWKAPDTVILPVGNGTLLLGAYIGFKELFNAGITARVPRLIAIQSDRCPPLYRAFKDNLDEIPDIIAKPTLAEGIAIAKPVRGRQIVDAVTQTDGDFITVSDSELKASLKEICGKGFYIEPTSPATIAGVSKYLRQSGSHETVVSIFTGHGLKSTEKMGSL